MIDRTIHRGQRALVRRLPGVWPVIAALALVACAPSDTGPAAADDAGAKAVRVATVVENDAARVFTLTGVSRAASRARLAFQTSGRLVERPVEIGDEVAQGALVARISQPELGPAADAAQADVNRLNTQLAQARRDLDRVERLVERNAATRQELENARSRRDSLSAQLSQARAQRERARNAAGELELTAPIAGTVEQVFFESGEFVPAGQPVVALSGQQALEVEIGLPERLLSAVAPGDPAHLSLPFFAARPIGGTVTRVARAAGGPGQLFSAVIQLDADPQLRAGLSVNWRLRSPTEPGLLVPTDAVASPGTTDRPRVYRVVDGVATPVAVTLGEIVGERVIVQGDIAAGDRVVTVGLNNLAAGRRVRLLDD